MSLFLKIFLCCDLNALNCLRFFLMYANVFAAFSSLMRMCWSRKLIVMFHMEVVCGCFSWLLKNSLSMLQLMLSSFFIIALSDNRVLQLTIQISSRVLNSFWNTESVFGAFLGEVYLLTSCFTNSEHPR